MNKEMNMSYRRNASLIVICTALCVVLSISISAIAQSNTADIVAKMPAQTPAEGEALAASLLQLGPAAVKDLCGMLVPPGAGDDANVRFALSGLAKYVTRAGAEAERAVVAGAAAEALEAAQDKEVKDFLISLLQITGKDEVVGALAPYLGDDRLCEPAALALVTIGTTNAANALHEALPASAGPRRLSLINALGEIRCTAAMKELVPLATDADPLVRQTAWYALACIGDPAAVPVLKAAFNNAATPADLSKAATSYLAIAHHLLNAGDKEQSAEILRDLLKRPDDGRANIQCAALTLLTSALGASALNDLLAAVDRDIEIRGRALALASAIPGESATQEWVKKAREASPEIRAALLNMLGNRGDPSALPWVFEALKDPEKTVRLAAFAAARHLGGSEAVAPLAAALQAATEGDEIKAIKEALLRLPGDTVTAAAAAGLAATPPPARKALLEILAARRAAAHLEAVFAQTNDTDDAVRLAAIEALGNLVSENEVSRVIALLLSLSNDAERSAAQKVVVIAARQVSDTEQQAASILAALEHASNEQKAVLLPTLSGVGGKEALVAVAAASKTPDAAVKESAIRTLGDWPDASAIDDLLAVAKTVEDLTQQVVALRGYVRLVAAAAIPAEDKLNRYKEGMAAAKRPEEQKLVLGGLADVRTVPSLEYVAGYLDSDAVKPEAALAVVKIACPRDSNDKGIVDPKVVDALKRASGLIDDAEAKKKIETHIAQCSPVK